jgi:hypothetical protein
MLKTRPERANVGAPAPTDFISVAELARQIAVSNYVARKLLDRGDIPGARRNTPKLANSPWLIPATAPAAYLSRFDHTRLR